jgi:hypothetical protein
MPAIEELSPPNTVEIVYILEPAGHGFTSSAYLCMLSAKEGFVIDTQRFNPWPDVKKFLLEDSRLFSKAQSMPQRQEILQAQRKIPHNYLFRVLSYVTH